MVALEAVAAVLDQEAALAVLVVLALFIFTTKEK
jgi:hypothetical protein